MVDYVAAGLVYCLSCLCPSRTVVAVVKLLVGEVCVVVVVVVGDFWCDFIGNATSRR